MVNRVVLVGRLTRDAEVRTATSGRSIATFTVAVNDRQKGEDGKPTTSFIGCIAFGNTAENMSKYTRKGSLVGVDGVLRQRKFQRKDGTNSSTIEVLCDSVQFLESKNTSYEDIPPYDEVSAPAKNSNAEAQDPTPEDIDTLDLPEEDLPF